MLTIPLI